MSDFNVTSLTDYTKENLDLMLGSLYFSKSSTEYFYPMVGVKYKSRFHDFTNTLEPVAYSCGWTGTTSTVFGEREIEVATLKNEATYCVNDLKNKYFSELMAKGVQEEEFPYEELILSDLRTQIPIINENILWNGSKQGSEGNYLDLADGIFTILTGETAVVTGATGTTTITNIQEQIDSIIDLLPDVLMDKPIVLFTSLTNVTLYKRYLFRANLFHVNANGPGLSENTVAVPYYSNVVVVGVQAFNGADKWVATIKNNLVMGMDNPGEDQDSDVFFDRKTREINVFNKWRIGSQILIPAYCATVNV